MSLDTTKTNRAYYQPNHEHGGLDTFLHWNGDYVRDELGCFANFGMTYAEMGRARNPRQHITDRLYTAAETMRAMDRAFNAPLAEERSGPKVEVGIDLGDPCGDKTVYTYRFNVDDRYSDDPKVHNFIREQMEAAIRRNEERQQRYGRGFPWV